MPYMPGNCGRCETDARHPGTARHGRTGTFFDRGHRSRFSASNQPSLPFPSLPTGGHAKTRTFRHRAIVGHRLPPVVYRVPWKVRNQRGDTPRQVIGRRGRFLARGHQSGLSHANRGQPACLRPVPAPEHRHRRRHPHRLTGVDA